ncbi:MAG: DUF1570 domain-containing protein [Planctomycetaceae bacterium]|jgi:hypothetical protein|nr:DUF1570 domain-containing protein [Planctomycetaceae bacterium]
MLSFRCLRSIFCVVLLTASAVTTTFALDYVTVQENGKKVKREGRIIAEDTGGSFVLEERDGYWRVFKPKEILEQRSDDKAFMPYTHAEMKKRLLLEFPKQFRIHETKHYLIVFDTTLAYARWCGNLLEQLDTSFLEHWKKNGFELTEPEFPLVAVIFADRGNFIRCTEPEVGNAVAYINAYYNQMTNRIVFYDLTGLEIYGNNNRVKSSSLERRFREIMSRPDSAKSIATFVHEAAHQISYNCGMIKRFSSCPHWVSEGIATLYETPDLDNDQAWSDHIKVNPLRLKHFYKYVIEREPLLPIRKVVTSDDPFVIVSSENALDAYAICWSMMYFFHAKQNNELIRYLKMISQKEPFLTDDEFKRISDFEEIFGNNWEELHQAYYKFMGTL